MSFRTIFLLVTFFIAAGYSQNIPESRVIQFSNPSNDGACTEDTENFIDDQLSLATKDFDELVRGVILRTLGSGQFEVKSIASDLSGLINKTSVTASEEVQKFDAMPPLSGSPEQVKWLTNRSISQFNHNIVRDVTALLPKFLFQNHDFTKKLPDFKHPYSKVTKNTYKIDVNKARYEVQLTDGSKKLFQVKRMYSISDYTVLLETTYNPNSFQVSALRHPLDGTPKTSKHCGLTWYRTFYPDPQVAVFYEAPGQSPILVDFLNRSLLFESILGYKSTGAILNDIK